jgi:chromosomal replication initiator protein
VPGRPRSLDEIVELVARAYSLSIDELSGPSRRRHVLRPRQIGMYLCRLYTEASFKEIGRTFRRDPTTVMHAVETLEKRIVERPQLRYELETLALRISPSPRNGNGGGSNRGTRRT